MGDQPVRKHDKAIEDGWRRQVQRIIAHVDLDAFYSQVEVKNDPERLTGKPVGVMQYNPFGDLASYAPHEDRVFNDSNGSLIAVSYEARAYGVKRNMRGDEARKLCPELMQVQVPTAHGKADLTHYRAAGKQVTDILARLSVCEKASIDECYLDITKEARRRLDACQGQLPLPPSPDQIHICGQEGVSAETWWQRSEEDWTEEERLLACGASAVADLRAAVKAELGFTCSAGISNCKILAKLASGMHKPSQQTVVPAGAVTSLLEDLPIPKLRQLGGKLGDEVMRVLNIKTVGQLAVVPKSRLTQFFPDSQACWLHELAHGIDADEVKQRTLPKSIGCGKTFHGKHTLYKLEDVTKWVGELAKELEERVNVDQEENSREPKLVAIHASSNAVSWSGNAISRSGPLRRPTADVIAEDAINLLKKWTSMTPNWSITGLSLVVSNFVAAPRGRSTLARFFKPTAGIKSAGRPHQEASADKHYSEIDTKSGTAQAESIAEMRDGRSHAQPISSNAEAAQPLGGNSERHDRTSEAALPWEYPLRGTAASPIGLERNSVEDEPSEVPQASISASPEPSAKQESGSTSRQRTGDQHGVLQTGPTSPHDKEQQDEAKRKATSEAAGPAETDAMPSSTGAENAMPAACPEGVDPEVWQSLPKDIQRELRLQAMSALGRKPVESKPPISQTRPAKKAKATRPIANFFAKKAS